MNFNSPEDMDRQHRSIREQQDREKAARENPAVQRGLEQARKGEFADDPRTNRRSGDERRQEPRRADDAPKPVQLSTDDLLVELRGLASTVRQCQRNGHPDASKHLEALLTKLGV